MLAKSLSKINTSKFFRKTVSPVRIEPKNFSRHTDMARFDVLVNTNTELVARIRTIRQAQSQTATMLATADIHSDEFIAGFNFSMPTTTVGVAS